MIADALRGAFSRGHVIGETNDEYAILTGGMATASGERVTKETALKVAAVYGGVSIIVSAVRAMPLRVVTDRGDGVLRPDRSHRLWPLLHDRPNPEMHASELWEWVTRALILRGNAYLWIERQPNGRVRWLRPINPARVQVGRDRRTRQKVFVIGHADDHEQVEFVGTTDEILHIRGAGDDPLCGVSVIHHMRETIGRALAEDRHAAASMKNQGRPSGILKVEGTLKPEQAERLRDRWQAAHGGSRSGGTAVLEEGATWEQVTLSAADLELVRQRAISREDIAVALALPGDMLLVGKEATLHYSSDASRDMRFLKHAVMPWAKRVQDALEITDMLPWGNSLPRFNPDGLLKTDIKFRYEAHKLGIEGRFLLPNEARRIEDLDPIPGGDSFPPTPNPEPSSRNGHRAELPVLAE